MFLYGLEKHLRISTISCGVYSYEQPLKSTSLLPHHQLKTDEKKNSLLVHRISFHFYNQKIINECCVKSNNSFLQYKLYCATNSNVINIIQCLTLILFSSSDNAMAMTNLTFLDLVVFHLYQSDNESSFGRCIFNHNYVYYCLRDIILIDARNIFIQTIKIF